MNDAVTVRRGKNMYSFWCTNSVGMSLNCFKQGGTAGSTPRDFKFLSIGNAGLYFGRILRERTCAAMTVNVVQGVDTSNQVMMLNAK